MAKPVEGGAGSADHASSSISDGTLTGPGGFLRAVKRPRPWPAALKVVPVG